MNNWKSSFVMKVTCFIISLCSIAVLMTSGLLSIYLAENRFFDRTEKEIREEWYLEFSRVYQAMAIKHIDDTDKLIELQNNNFKYAVVEGKDIDKIDISNSKNYIATNKSDTFPKNGIKNGTVSAESWDVGDNTEISYDTNILSHHVSYYTEDFSQQYGESVSQTITGYYYDIDAGVFYYQLDGTYIPVKEVTLYNDQYDFSSSFSYDNNQHAYYNKDRRIIENPYMTFQDLNNILDWNWTEWRTVGFDNSLIDREQIAFVNEGTVFEEEVINETYQYTGATSIVVGEQDESGIPIDELTDREDMHHYWVIYQVQQPLQSYENDVNNGWLHGDLYEQGETLLVFFYQVRFGIVIALVVSGILWGISSLLLLIMAGHKKGEEKACGSFLTIVPIDVLSFIVILLETLIIGGFAITCQTGVSIWTVIMFWIFFMLGYCVGFAFLVDFMIRIKMGKWWRNTLGFRFCAWITRPFRRGLRAARENLPLTIKACIVLGIAALFEVFVIIVTGHNPAVEVFMWIIWKVITCSMILACVLQIGKLNQAVEEMAQGRIEEQVDTSKMIWEFKHHGDNLNRIKEGINTAVVEKMKSERFKTELITNVSHDIKTPLTSIINYVDLLEKEEVDNPKVQEYVEVLTRQSKRLKNLIEDLMEASKASTGNIEMHFEQINLTVLLSQILGEFEDRLVQHNFDIVIQKPDQDICIQADGRHLWRVLDNLLVNICKYAMEGTRVYIDFNLYQDSQYVDIAFKNISRNQLNISGDELLQRFVRGDASRNTEGNGLGLSIAQSLTELMHGTLQITVDGDLFKVSITFPVDLLGEEKFDEEKTEEIQ